MVTGKCKAGEVGDVHCRPLVDLHSVQGIEGPFYSVMLHLRFDAT